MDKFKSIDRDTHSVEQEDMSRTKSLKQDQPAMGGSFKHEHFTMGGSFKHNPDDEDFGLVSLFEEEDEDCGLADLFLEEDVCEAELDRVLRGKNRNSLYDEFDKNTFIRNGTIICATPVKRKLCPSDQTPGERFNKLSMKLYNSQT